MSKPGPEQQPREDDSARLHGAADPMPEQASGQPGGVDVDESLHNMGGASGPADVGAPGAGEQAGGGGLGPGAVREINDRSAAQREEPAADDEG